jgi:hypothetical protein
MSNAELAVELLIAIINQAATISALLAKAKEEGRDLNSDELDGLALGDDLTRANLVIAIAKRRTQEKSA